MEHNEFVVEFKDGTRDWVDPVYGIEEDDDYITVSNGTFEYTYDKKLIDKWIVRTYSAETTYEPIGDEK